VAEILRQECSEDQVNIADIELTLNTRLEGLALGLPIAWPNMNYSGVKPYLAVQIVIVSVENTDVTALKETTKGKYNLAIVSDLEKGQTFSIQKGALIKNGFPAGLRIGAASGIMTIMKPPEIRDGFRDEADWRVPVIIDFQTFT
jgi:hypothetical protein